MPTNKTLPCMCGNKILTIWSGYGSFTIKCPKCGKEAYGRNKIDVTNNWNQMIREERDKNERTDVLPGSE